jgi:hypothetical protein
MPSKTKRSMWTNEAIKVVRVVIEIGTHSLRMTNKSIMKIFLQYVISMEHPNELPC